MSRYATAVDLRRALEARLRQRADESGTDLSRLRRVAVFDRIAARLSAAERGWVLKGGASLEFRLGARARATKDIDLALPDGPCDGDDLREELIETLAVDVDGVNPLKVWRRSMPLRSRRSRLSWPSSSR
ncbi:nucleotidyl transferase AbiEii/AbiGii toxin family protein [Actinomadura latina]|uniref:Nucleotidyl transferase AbiEii/AbiGii toxin family protein n=1 Tax=Actinomadura latina TaxID=163603 RepID=A0A846YTX4_9ACTN|nr:nucleotidyl transferase AbiEii/AbiGii toxin family protein [Actinomadura latina]NKZ03829.1 nucleotidyl transferase AbiEii/AbiGii toxin family protein [Actinomadura latina]